MGVCLLWVVYVQEVCVCGGSVVQLTTSHYPFLSHYIVGYIHSLIHEIILYFVFFENVFVFINVMYNMNTHD